MKYRSLITGIYTFLLITLAPFQATAYSFESNGLFYDINPNGVSATVTYDAYGYGNYVGDIVIPDTVKYDGNVYQVTTIGDNAFRACSQLTSITLGDRIREVKSYAFYNCTGLSKVELGEGITAIGEYAFSLCSSLSTISLPAMLKTIGTGAFRGCSSLTGTVVIPSEVSLLGHAAFLGCKTIEAIEIPASVTKIGSGAFQSCTNLGSVKIERGDKPLSIGLNAFLYSTSIYTVLTNDAVKWASIQFENTLSNPMYYSHSLVADGERVIKITFHEGVTTIGKYAFINDYNIRELELPASITEVGDSAFFHCYKLEDITCKSINPVDIGTVFDDGTYQRASVAVPIGGSENYNNHPSWSQFNSIVELEPITIPGDINGDGSCDTTDISAMLSRLLVKSDYDAIFDLNDDGSIDGTDSSSLLEVVLRGNAPSTDPELISHWNELPTLNILTLGNSFTDDALGYFRELRQSLGLKAGKVNIYGIYVGSASIEDYVNIFESDEHVNNGRLIQYEGNPERWKPVTLRDVLSRHWDIITLQQRSAFAGDYSTYEPYLSKLIEYIHATCPNDDVKLGWELEWGTAPKTDNDPGRSHWEKKVNACKEMLANTPDISFVIPVGTSFQNARALGIKNDRYLTRDNFHVCFGVGRYALTCAWWETVIYPWSGISMMGNNSTHRITPSQALKSLYYNIPITERNNFIIQLCAKAAVDNPYELSDEAIRQICHDRYHIDDIPSMFNMY